MELATQSRLLALISLAFLLVGTPAAILAADPGGSSSNNVYLPFQSKPGWPGATGTLGNGGRLQGPGQSGPRRNNKSCFHTR